MRIVRGALISGQKTVLCAASLAACAGWLITGCAGNVPGSSRNGNSITPNGNTTPTPNGNTGTEPVANTNTGTNSNSDGTNARPIITTVAGAGYAGFAGETGAALETALYLPVDATVGPGGALYIVDWNNHRVRVLGADGQIDTLIGSGQIGDAPDGDPLATQLNHPTNVVFNSDGNLIVAAWHNSRVKLLDFTTGNFENLAGTGRRAFNGDGMPANMTDLDLPSSVGVDSNGLVYFTDQANQRIRRIEEDGTIVTICGNGPMMRGYTGDGAPAVMATINSPVGQAAPPAGRLDIDSRDRIFFADTANHVIRMIDVDGTITTVAGVGETPGMDGDGGPATAARLNTPSDVEVVVEGNNTTLYIADTMNHAVRRVNPDGTIETIAGRLGERGFEGDGAAAVEALLDRPFGLTVGPDGTLYIADTHNHRIRRVTAELPDDFDPNAGGTPDEVVQLPCTDDVGSICTWAGTGLAAYNGDGANRLQTALYWPFDLEFTPSGKTYVLDWNNHLVREVLPDQTFRIIIGTDFVGDGPADLSDLMPPGAPGDTVTLNHPTDLIELADGTLVVVAWHNHKLRQYDPATGRVLVLSGRGGGFGPCPDPMPAPCTGEGTASDPLTRYNQPAHAVLDADGNLFLVDQRNQRLRVIRNFATELGGGEISTVLGTGVAGATGDGVPPLETQVRFPAGGNPEPTGGIAIDASGVIYFSDTLNHRIRRVAFTDLGFDGGTVSGAVTTIAGTGMAGRGGDGPALESAMEFPGDIEIGPDGNLYFADTNNNRVRMVDLATGVVTTVAGTGDRGYSGDGNGQQAVAATFNRPFGIAFDAAGDLYIADSFNGRIRRVTR